MKKILFCMLMVWLFLDGNALSQQQSKTEEKPKLIIRLADYQSWKLLKSEKVRHPTDKNLTAVVEKFKNPLADEWVILAKINDDESKDSWQRTFFLKLGTKLNPFGVQVLLVCDIIPKSHDVASKVNDWLIDNYFGVTSDDDTGDDYFNHWIDNFYEEFVDGLKKSGGSCST